MTNLTTSAVQKSAILPPPLGGRGAAILLQTPVRNTPKRQVFDMVLISVAKAFADLNNKSISKEERDYMVNELTDNIIKHYPSIRISEIPLAIAEGIRGKYGEYYGLSVVSFEKFIEQYLLSEPRTRAVKEMPMPLPQKQMPDQDEQFALAKSNVLMALQRKMTGQPISNMASSVYDFLDRLQLLQFTKHEKYDMMADAARELIGELQFKLITAPVHERMALRRDKDAYISALTGGALNDEQNKNIIRISKRLALDAFLQQVMLEELDLGEMVGGQRSV